MAWTKYQLSLALVMVVTGTINTLSTKWADKLRAKSRDGVERNFDHPFFQASCMFLGEFLCYVAFKVLYKVLSRRCNGSEDVHELTKGNRDFNKFKLFIPAMCDMTSTSLMYIGLNLTYASSFQMFRGAVIIFVGILSVGFLDRVLKKREWTGMVLVIVGLTIVGLADFVNKDTNTDNHGKNDIITGDLLIVIAQIITATQMVIEEKYVTGLDIPPLQAVGLEGIFGFTVLACLQVPFYFIKVGPPFSDNYRGVLEDAIDAFVQMGNNYLLVFAILGTILSIAFFNFAGISVTKELSATTRMVLDSVRTFFIWMLSLGFTWQQFHWLQLLGFAFLLFGMCLYNGITCAPCIIYIRNAVTNLRYRHLNDDVVENRAADEAYDRSA
ncbi:hypothetical protein RI129_012827 [Pyrocoelia pectoralis]|uniref:Solute carrier family 35 member F6 n=1 Tax=Pyrocoelia pectoralis TaxID=417401 RepID=A0AAN7UZ38_9COLE